MLLLILLLPLFWILESIRKVRTCNGLNKYRVFYSNQGVYISMVDLHNFLSCNNFLANKDEYDENDLQAPLYRTVEINNVPVRLKWCNSCHFYRPPRCSHCSICNCCVEVSFRLTCHSQYKFLYYNSSEFELNSKL